MSSDEDRPEREEASLEVSEVKGQVETLEEQRQFLLAHTENLEHVIQGLRREARLREAEILALKAKVQGLEAGLAVTEQAYHAVLGSRSWRLLAPLRAATDALRRLRGAAPR